MSDTTDIKEALRFFRLRDENAVSQFNEMAQWHGASLEMRLAFAESRCEDAARVLCLVMEKIAELETRLAHMSED
jgi:hypothetical protein